MKHVRTITFGFVFLLGAIALGQQANIKLSPQAPAKDAKAVGLKHNEVARTFTFNLSQHNADVRVVLLQMSENEERAIVMSPAVQGSLSIEFRGATFDEALGIIAKVMDFQLVNVGSRVLVYTRAEWDLKQQKMGVRTYRFHNIRAKEASELLGGVLLHFLSGKVDLCAGLHREKLGAASDLKIVANRERGPDGRARHQYAVVAQHHGVVRTEVTLEALLLGIVQRDAFILVVAHAIVELQRVLAHREETYFK